MANMKNSEGYMDLTPYQVILKEEKEAKKLRRQNYRANELIKHIKYICRVSGFTLTELEIYDKRNDKYYNK